METIKTVRHETTLTRKEVFSYGIKTAYETYGKEEVEVPSGFETINEFRPPIVGEYFIGKGAGHFPVYASKPFREPRFILQKKKDPVTFNRYFIFKAVARKFPLKGDWFKTSSFGTPYYVQAEYSYDDNVEYEVYERIEL